MGQPAKAAVRDYFDRDVVGYLKAYTTTNGQVRGDMFRERRRLTLNLLGKSVGRVLDVGSGPGVFTKALLDRGAECWMVDLSPAMVSMGRAQFDTDPRAHRVHYQVGDVECLPFCAGIFDNVLCIGVFQYLVGPEVALQELSRVTKSGGHVIVSVLNRRSPLNGLHLADDLSLDYLVAARRAS